MKYDWLESAVFYEVYPTSFYDSDGDGTGDIRGIIEKLDYIKDLGANGIWLNPCFESPFQDGGYDISDYYTAGKKFGTNKDMKELFEKAEKMGIKILLDLVMGHTSIRHPWFEESQKDEKNEHTKTYIWKPMDNPAESKSGQFLCGMSERPEMFRVNYYSIQPAINYGYYKPKEGWQDAANAPAPMKNRERLIDVCKFWLAMGAAGFRVDMANHMIKNDPKRKGNIEFWNDVIPRIKAEFPDAVFVSEWFNPSQSVQKSSFDIDFSSGYFLYYKWCGNNLENFSKTAYLGENGEDFIPAITQIYAAGAKVKKRGYQAITLGNHDRHRMSLGRSFDQMKTAFAFHLTMPHVPFIYYGDEIGMSYNRDIKSKDGGYHRTGSRTPMQWTNGKNRGFSTADEKDLYLPVEKFGTETAENEKGKAGGADKTAADKITESKIAENGAAESKSVNINNAAAHSVESQTGDKNSLLETVRELIGLKRKLKCLRAESPYKLLSFNLSGLPHIYKRTSDADEVIVILYPKKEEKTFSIKKLGDISGYKIISNNMEFQGEKCLSKGEGFAVLYRGI
ncbi:MAG: glycosylase [Clostridiales bacterium]|jgi:maltose alpha-D-glucosyltransferase/alpha-amylase|nr:glycosylase [Clostridiales bacterium]